MFTIKQRVVKGSTRSFKKYKKDKHYEKYLVTSLYFLGVIRLFSFEKVLDSAI